MNSVQNGGRLENYEKYLLKDINLYFLYLYFLLFDSFLIWQTKFIYYY